VILRNQVANKSRYYCIVIISRHIFCKYYIIILALEMLQSTLSNLSPCKFIYIKKLFVFRKISNYHYFQYLFVIFELLDRYRKKMMFFV
jgi:hypothetical protein